MDKRTNVDKSIEEYVSFLKKKFSPQKILLFGSRARGDHFNFSDVDILVISKKFEKIHFLDRLSQLQEGWNNSLNLDSIGLTPNEFENRKNELSIIGSAAREGIEI